jgi:hypothetical protein
MSMRKFVLAFVGLVLSITGHWALAAEPAAQPKATGASSAPAKQQVAKHAATKPTAAHQTQAKPKPASAPKYYYVRGTSTVAAPAAALLAPAAAEQVPAAAPELGDVHTGRMVCELGNSVTVTPDPQQPSRFVVQIKRNTYFMTPVATTTGAVRLEDAQAGAMWLQLPHKSMLMNSKLGQRMADECQSEHQTAAAHVMKLNPPPSLLDHSTMAIK